VTLKIQQETPRQPGIIDLLEQSDAYAQSLYPPESNHMLDLSGLEQPGACLLVARHDGDIVGCCALIASGDGSGEIKRMFVHPKARGMRVGKALLDALEARALEDGLKTIRLETGIYQPEAISLYTKAGFRDIEPFGSYKPDPLSLFMEKQLA
jgi:putative acetyltransferase